MLMKQKAAVKCSRISWKAVRNERSMGKSNLNPANSTLHRNWRIWRTKKKSQSSQWNALRRFELPTFMQMTILSNEQNANGGSTEGRNSIGFVLLGSEIKNNSLTISAAVVVWSFKLCGYTVLMEVLEHAEEGSSSAGLRRRRWSRVEATESYWVGPWVEDKQLGLWKIGPDATAKPTYRLGITKSAGPMSDSVHIDQYMFIF